MEEKKKNSVRRPELLAPAGTLEIAVAAFDAGADAVYAGLTRFNARERAGNFTLDDLRRCLDYAHGKGRKVYVVFNTLLKEEELPDAARMLADLAWAAPDALIVQDLGAARIARKYFPALPLHASTQLGIHNLAGVRMAAELGFQRVILERQLSLEEVAFIARHTPLELETFIHGSLCCSLSGRCLLSSFLGGMSGNRGKCKQPCRRAFRLADGRFANLLSPRDLDGSSLVAELARIGIASLKIEGRLRGPEYVWKTVRAYRLLLDALPQIPPEVAAEAATLLRSTSTRRSSEGFYRQTAQLIEAGNSGTFGVEAARLTGRRPDGSWLCSAVSRLHLGDRVRLTPPEGGEGESFSLTVMRRPDGRGELLKVTAGMSFLLPGSGFRAGMNWKLYKIGENGFDFSRAASALPAGRNPLHLTVAAAAGCWQAAIEELPDFCWRIRTAFSPADKHPVTAESIAQTFTEAVPEPWRAARVNVTVEGAFFAPGKLVKELRREFWLAAAEALKNFDPRTPLQAALARWQEAYAARRPADPLAFPSECRCVIPAFLPPFEEEKVKKELTGLAASCWEVNGLHALALLNGKAGIRAGCWPLAVANSEAAAAVQELGCLMAEAAPELDRAAYEKLLARSPLPLYRGRGPLPLLVSRLPLRPVDSPVTDGAGRNFVLRRDCREPLTCLYPENDDTVRKTFFQSEWK